MKFFDGAMGSLLIEKGVRPKNCCGVLNVTDRDIIVGIHKEYINVGVEYVTTNTFLANRFMLEGSGFTVEEVIKSGIENVRQAILACGKKESEVKIVQSISMGGKFKSLCEEYSFNDAYELFKEQILVGEKYGTDVYLFETFLDLEELKAGIVACKENSNKPVFVTMPFGKNEDNEVRTLMGVEPKVFAKTVDELGADVIGVNCCFGADMITEALKDIKEVTNKKLIVQPNRGIPTVLNGVTSYSVDKYEFLEEVSKICEVGVDFVGGCCGTTAEVMGLVKSLKKVNNK